MTERVHKLRPFLPADTASLRELFAQSIEELTQESYDEDQRLAWIATAEDAAKFQARLAAGVTLIIGPAGKPHGFATLLDSGEIDFLYVHPHATGQGIATTLIDALERIAAARHVQTLSVDASDTALGFFEARGYVPFRRNSRHLGDVWLYNTTLKKQLTQAAPKANA